MMLIPILALSLAAAAPPATVLPGECIVVAAVKAMADGLRSPRAVGRKTLIVRIPPIENDGAAIAKANGWSPSNPAGDTIAMLMLEDPAAIARAPRPAPSTCSRRRSARSSPTC